MPPSLSAVSLPTIFISERTMACFDWHSPSRSTLSFDLMLIMKDACSFFPSFLFLFRIPLVLL